MKIKTALCIGTCLTLSFTQLNALTFSDGYSGTVLATTIDDGTYTQYEGLSADGGNVYVGNFRRVLSYNTSSGTMSTYATLPGNNGISHVTAHSGTVYSSSYTSSSEPYPYTLGKVSGSSSFSEITTMGGIFDADFSPQGSLYFVANPDVDSDDKGDGSRLYRLNTSNDNITEVAYLGGASGGLAFDQAGNLFYSHYDNGIIYKFSAADLMTSGLTLTDANAVLSLPNCGYLDIDASGNLLATSLDSESSLSSLSLYNIETGEKIAGICTGLSSNFVEQDGTIYVIEQSWDFSGDYGSNLIAITAAVPEPATYTLLGGLICIVFITYKRRKA